MKLNELTKIWLRYKENTIKKTSIFQYEGIIERYIDEYLGEKELGEFEVVDVLSFIDTLRQLKLSNKTIQDVIVVLKSILKYGKMMHYVSIPLQAIPIPRVNQKEVGIFSKNEVEKLEDYLLNHVSERNMGIYICLYTGMRLGEICALKGEDIILEDRKILVNKTLQRVQVENKSVIQVGEPKTKQSLREVPISDHLYDYIKKIDYKDCAYILTNTEKYLDPRTYQYYFKKVLDNLDIKEGRFHTLRHTFASYCIQCNVDIKSLSEILGHASVNITLNCYVHSSFSAKKVQINKLSYK